MKRFDERGRGLSLLLAAALMVLGTTEAAADGGSATVSMVVFDLANLGKLPLDAAFSEVASSLRPLGIGVSWRVAEPGRENAEALRVVLLGKRPCGGNKGESVLASVTPANEAATIWVCMPNLIAMTAVRTPTGLLWVNPRVRVGVGLGRVIVHEMVHLADPGLRHAKSGLTSSNLNRTELFDAQCHLEWAAQQALSQASTRWQEPPEGAAPLVTDLSR